MPEERDTALTDLKHFLRHLFSKLGRKGAFILLFVVFLSVATLAGWKTGFFAKLAFEYNRAEIMVIVEDGETGRPLVGISVEADGQVLETDEQGKVFFERLQKGTVTFKVSLPGFKDFFQTAGLNRGPNKELVFPLQIATAEVSGAVVDYVDGTPIVGAKVIAPGAEATTDKDGEFVLEEVIIGTPEVTVNKEGYYDFKQKVELVKNVAKEMGELKLLGKGKVVFDSNRDGNNAIYWARLDGSDSGKIWENKAGFDDYEPYLSPDKQKIIFLSNRDNQKDEYGFLEHLLYYNDISGKSLQKLSFDPTPLPIGWLADGSGFVYNETTLGGDEIKIIKTPTLAVSTLVKSSDFGYDAELSLITLSPESDWVAFFVNSDQPDNNGVYLIHPDGTGQKRISSAYAHELLKFSGDGKRVIYFDPVEGVGDSGAYYVYNVATGTETKTSPPSVKGRLSDRLERYQTVEVYSSAQKLKAFVDYRDWENDIYVSKKDGSAERRITFSFGGLRGGIEQVYFAGPNDRYLVYYSVDWPQEKAIYVIGLKEGSKPLKVTSITSGFAGVVPE